MADFEDYYEILDVSPETTSEEIKGAYRDKCWILHDDRLEGAPDSAKRLAREQLKKVNRAYDILKDPQKRREYHAEWLKRKAKPKPAVKPSRIRFANMAKGQTKRTSFVIDNIGGAYTKIWFSNPDSWLRVIDWHSISSAGELPLEVVIEAEASDWGINSTEYITVKLDKEEAQLVVQLQAKPQLIMSILPAPINASEATRRRFRDFQLMQCSCCERFFTTQPLRCPYRELHSNCILLEELSPQRRHALLYDEKWLWQIADMVGRAEQKVLRVCRKCEALNPNPQKSQCWYCGEPLYSR